MKTVLAAVLTVAAALTVSSCGSDSSGASDGKRIGYISYNDSLPYVATVTKSIKQAAEDANAELIFCDSAGNAETALQCAINLKSQHVDGLINYQGDVKAAGQICSQGPQVPVIAISIRQEPCMTAWTGSNDVLSGTLAGRGIGEFFKKEFDCNYDAYISIEVPKNGQVTIDRMGGFRTGFEEVCGKIHDERVLASQGLAEDVKSSMTDALTAIPQATRIVVVGQTDPLVEGALAAAAASNRSDDVYVAGQGLDSSGVCGMRENPGHWIGDTAFFPEKYGATIIPQILAAIDGEEIPEVIASKQSWVSSQDIDKVYGDVKC
jgi:ribose transport system substrate-binding protein